jgi:hypothetical protein
MTGTVVQFQACTRDFSLLYSIQTVSEGLPAFCPNDTKGSFPRDKAALHSELSLRMHGVIFPFPSTSRGVMLHQAQKEHYPFFLSFYLYTVAHLTILPTCATQ